MLHLVEVAAHVIGYTTLALLFRKNKDWHLFAYICLAMGAICGLAFLLTQ
jgi:hypothetical protein